MNKLQWKLHNLKWRVYWTSLETWSSVSKHLFGGCEHCGKLWGVKPESSRTFCHVEGIEGRENTPVDPNLDVRLCRDCAYDHHLHWDYQWDEYYAGCL